MRTGLLAYPVNHDRNRCGVGRHSDSAAFQVARSGRSLASLGDASTPRNPIGHRPVRHPLRFLEAEFRRKIRHAVAQRRERFPALRRTHENKDGIIGGSARGNLGRQSDASLDRESG